MKKYIAIILAAALLALSGCMSASKDFTLPQVSADSLTYSRTDPLGGTQIEATGVKVTEDAVTADTASWNTTYPSFTVKLNAKGYRRERSQEEKTTNP